MRGITGLALALALSGAALVTGGMAHADTYGSKGDESGAAYGQEMRDLGMVGNNSSAANLGWTVCTQRVNMSERDLIAALTPQYGANNVVAIVTRAEWHFCPEYWRFGDGD